MLLAVASDRVVQCRGEVTTHQYEFTWVEPVIKNLTTQDVLKTGDKVSRPRRTQEKVYQHTLPTPQHERYPFAARC